MHGIIFNLFQLYREYLTFPYSNLDYISEASLGDSSSCVACAVWKQVLSETSINDNCLPGRQIKEFLLHKLSPVGQTTKIMATDVDISLDVCSIYTRSEYSLVVSQSSE
ncbi:MAG: hypothetical protein P2A85_12920 [Microcoleus anatoxicus]|uniref:Uncharacterized protein n=1 Tax=Microcoleus anatoxicus PTRS2 TaxID=2705321 RepID=A0ABU8YIP1_9CYAN|nr:MAG: hypothetical protein EA000_11005 [Oscillatoriales cyanobacterium]TAD98315.1 MAG: hypothetical protein EAZ98_06980 [Oscillatoriales cyanobacterium]TAE05545.1 MAG: hypothetical protein EAZ96_05160 [Oscillatoriales cyanobacterium]TAF02706.1 MAG: hypothetical protein EAZ78_14635 [Oscillatoriales cyanobacterium]TAF35330.1 MAG: hypothetical protein EAZ68_18315 [Oscillatoriales cyanobacterium]